MEVLKSDKMNNRQPKTLEEITPANEFHRNKFSVRNENAKLYEDKDLKQAAIEWVKYFQTEKERSKKYKSLYVISAIIYDAKIRVLMEFFNLTEDDLR